MRGKPCVRAYVKGIKKTIIGYEKSSASLGFEPPTRARINLILISVKSLTFHLPFKYLALINTIFKRFQCREKAHPPRLFLKDDCFFYWRPVQAGPKETYYRIIYHYLY